MCPHLVISYNSDIIFSLWELYFMAFFTCNLSYCIFGNTIVTSFFSLLLIFLILCYCCCSVLLTCKSVTICFCSSVVSLGFIYFVLPNVIIMVFFTFFWSDQYLLLLLMLGNAIISDSVIIMDFCLLVGIAVPFGSLDLTS